MATVTITRKAGTTEPEEVTVDATGLDNLDDVSAGQWFAWDKNSGAEIIDGEANGSSSDGPGFQITDSANRKVELDPDGADTEGGNAFSDAGVLRATLKLIFSDSDIAFWPDSGYLEITLEQSTV